MKGEFLYSVGKMTALDDDRLDASSFAKSRLRVMSGTPWLEAIAAINASAVRSSSLPAPGSRDQLSAARCYARVDGERGESPLGEDQCGKSSWALLVGCDEHAVMQPAECQDRDGGLLGWILERDLVSARERDDERGVEGGSSHAKRSLEGSSSLRDSSSSAVH